jgi:serine/threonine protein kinase
VDQVGRYRIVEELGRGAMAIVYKALDPAIGRTVAIKTIRLGDFHDIAEKQRVQERLLREAQSAGLLSHPNIVTIYDVLEQTDFAYIFMEYVNGASLEKMIRRRELPDSATLLRFLQQVSEALDYAHRKGIVHRDIKPANIIISEGPGAERVAKIADFGVAKFVSHEMTHSGTMIGTPSYMSPEQIQGITVDARSDQFSLGVVVYELLTGEKPFAAENLPALFYLICRQDPIAVESLNPSLAEAVNKVLRRALAKEPENRFAACGDFIGALSIALGDCSGWTAVPVRDSLLDLTIEATPGSYGSAEPERLAAVSGLDEEMGRAVSGSSAVAGGSAVLVRSGGGGKWSGAQVADESPKATPLRRDEIFEDLLESSEDSGPWKKLGVLAALCLAVAAIVVWAVRSNSGPSIPTQVIDTNPKTAADTNPKTAAPATPPDNAADARKRQNTAESPPPTPQDAAANAKSAENPPERKAPEAAAIQNPGTVSSNGKVYPENGVATVEMLSDPPGAKVVVDNNPSLVCAAPCTLSLSNGRHTLTAEAAGYNIARRIFFVPEERSETIALRKSQGTLVVRTEPPGSSVFVDGKEYGTTPATLNLPAGLHRLLIVNGLRQQQETIEVVPDTLVARDFRWQ